MGRFVEFLLKLAIIEIRVIRKSNYFKYNNIIFIKSCLEMQFLENNFPY